MKVFISFDRSPILPVSPSANLEIDWQLPWLPKAGDYFNHTLFFEGYLQNHPKSEATEYHKVTWRVLDVTWYLEADGSQNVDLYLTTDKDYVRYKGNRSLPIIEKSLLDEAIMGVIRIARNHSFETARELIENQFYVASREDLPKGDKR